MSNLSPASISCEGLLPRDHIAMEERKLAMLPVTRVFILTVRLSLCPTQVNTIQVSDRMMDCKVASTKKEI